MSLSIPVVVTYIRPADDVSVAAAPLPSVSVNTNTSYLVPPVRPVKAADSSEEEVYVVVAVIAGLPVQADPDASLGRHGVSFVTSIVGTAALPPLLM